MGARRMGEMILRDDGFWWPMDDDHCWRVIHSEVSDLDWAAEMCRQKRVAVQAGGNVGVWAARLAASFERVITVEPDADNYECLSRNAPANVTHRRAAFGAEPGTVGMHLEAGNSGAHWVEGPGAIPVDTIDALGLSACDLIVLDVEGYEARALRGARETICAFRPVVMFEDKGLGRRYYGEPQHAAQALMVSLGYRVAGVRRKDVLMVPA
jgi:FkbM family methyltransferase